MKLPKISRRAFLRLGIFSIPAYCVADAFLIEPEWLAVNRVVVGTEPTHRLVHFTDLHHKGDNVYLNKVVEKINGLSPDFVCFTGDIVEKKKYLSEALEAIERIRYPVIGVPGNHEYGISFRKVAKSFEATGGKWLANRAMTLLDGAVGIIGVSGRNVTLPKSPQASKQILLMHYPAIADDIRDKTFNLILAGHSHGGQVRIPFLGALRLPRHVGKYDRGLYQTQAGPLYVNPGIGYFYLHLRFFCRPELTVIEF